MGRNEAEGRIFLIADTHFGDENIRLYEADKIAAGNCSHSSRDVSIL